jgi:RND family efflux transporter MFP subunit
MANNTGIKLLVVVAVVAAGYFGVSLYLRPTATVQVVTGGKVAKAVSAQIKVRAENSLELKIEATGRMLNELKEGQAVAEGDVLVQVDTQAKEIDIENLENNLKTARATNEINEKLRASKLQRAKSDLALKKIDRDAKRLAALLYDQAEGQVSDLEFNQAMEKVLADDSIAQKELQIKSRRLELANMTLKAPFAGTLTDIKFSKGALISGGQTVATLLTNTRVVEARISEENFAKGVKENQRVRVRFTGIESDFFGTIGRILPAQNEQTLRYIAHLDLKIDPALLNKTGQSGDGVITIDEKEAKVRVSRRAIYNNRIYVVRGGKVEVRAPKLGYDSESVVEILSGVEPGEEVIVDRQEIFSDGQSVRTEKVAAAK